MYYNNHISNYVDLLTSDTDRLYRRGEGAAPADAAVGEPALSAGDTCKDTEINLT